MVGRVIRDYIERGAKKLTVPGFGTFMRREGGSVIFVDLLRGDDHVLSEMVEDRGGFSEVEAMAKIDRFIFEIKTSITRHGRATIEGFGTMTVDPNGVYQFDHTPRAVPVRERATQEKLFGADVSAAAPPLRPKPGGEGVAPADRAVETGGGPSTSAVGNDGGRDSEFSPRGAGRTPIPTPRPQEPPRRPATDNHTRESDPRERTPRGPRESRKLSGIDIILIVAIVAAVVALIAMVFGLTAAGDMPFMSDRN
jgi:nucleoid DNA-binding protein